MESCHTLCPRSGNTDTNRQLLSKLQYVGECTHVSRRSQKIRTGDYKGFEKYNQLLDPPLNLRDVQEAMALDCVDGGMRKKIDQFIQEIDEFKNEDSDEDEDEDEDENEYPDEKEND